MMYPKIELGEGQRAGVTRILDIVLADEYLLYTKTRTFHWNVVGTGLLEQNDGVDAPRHRVAPGLTARPIGR